MFIYEPKPSAGYNIGSALGQGIGGALQQLAQAKANQVQQRVTSEYLKKEFPEGNTAALLAMMPQDFQAQAIKSMQQQKANLAMGQFLNAMAGLTQTNPVGDIYSGQNTLQTQGANQAQYNKAPNAMSGLSPQQSITPEEVSQQQQGAMPVNIVKAPAEMFNTGLSQIPQGIDMRYVNPQQQMAVAGLGLKARSEARKAEESKQKLAQGEKKIALQERGIEAREKMVEGRIKQGEERIGIKKTELKQDIEKDWNKWLEPSIEAAKEAKKNIKDYEAIKKLAKSGNLRTPAFQKIAEYFGVEDVGRNVETQLFQKLTGRLSVAPSSAMGGKVTNYLDTVWQRRLPSLMNTPEGIEAIAELNILDDRMHEFEAQERQKFYHEHKSEVLPGDADAIIDDRLDKKRDQIQEKMLKTMEDAISKSNKTYVAQIGETLNELPDPKLYKKGDFFDDEENPSVRYINNGTKWEKTKRGV